LTARSGRSGPGLLPEEAGGGASAMPKKYQLQDRVSAQIFLENLAFTNQEFFFLAGYFLKVKKRVGRYFLNYLRREAHEVETILDDAEVFTNELFFFRELMAGIRWFCRAAFTLEEGIISRYDTRKLKDTPADRTALMAEAENTLNYFYTTIRKLCQEALRISADLGVVLPDKAAESHFIKIQGQPRLEKNRAIDSGTTPLDSVELLTGEFIGAQESLLRFEARLREGKATLNERDVIQINNSFHALESFYDTHLHDTLMERDVPDFWSLRGYIAMVLRFSEMLKDLVHFYERHLVTMRDPAIHDRFAELVDEKRLLKILVDFVLKNSARYVKDGGSLALELLTRVTGKVRRVIKIPIGVDGLHARPMTWIYKVCQRHGNVIFEVGGEKFEANSILSMLTMTEAIDRVIGLEDKDSQIVVAAGTVINELERRRKPVSVTGRRYVPQTVIDILESFRSEIRDKSGTRFVDVVASGPDASIREIEVLAAAYFKKEQLPPSLDYIFKED